LFPDRATRESRELVLYLVRATRAAGGRGCGGVVGVFKYIYAQNKNQAEPHAHRKHNEKRAWALATGTTGLTAGCG